MSLPQKTCPFCGYTWTPRTPNPLRCANPKCGKPLASDLPPYHDKDARALFPHIYNTIIAVDGVGLVRASAERELNLKPWQVESDEEILKARRRILKERSGLFETEIEAGVNEVLEMLLPTYPNDSSVRMRPKTPESEKEHRDLIRQAIKEIKANLDNPRNVAIAKDGYYVDPEGKVSSSNAEVRIGRQPVDFMTKALWLEKKRQFEEMLKLLEYGLELSKRRQKTLEDEIKARNEQREAMEKPMIKEANNIAEKGERGIKELEELSEKAGRLLQNGTIPAELNARFRELLKEVRELQGLYISKVHSIEQLGIKPAEVRPFPGLIHFPFQDQIIAGQSPPVKIPEPKKRKFPRLTGR